MLDIGDAIGRRSGLRAFARYSNLVLTSSLFIAWFLGLALSLTLVLTGSPATISNVSKSGSEAGHAERLYYIIATVTTAGFGDSRPVSATGRLFTILTALSGLIVTSLGISYVINLVRAVIDQRQLARAITNLGARPRDFLAAHWDGETFGALTRSIGAIATAILTQAQNHLAYPMLHYVRPDDDRDSLPVALALLDETMTVLIYNVPAAAQPQPAEVLAARRAVTVYLDSLRSAFVSRAEEVPPWPEVDFLRERYGFVPVAQANRATANELAGLERRRALLHAAVLSQGLSWELVTGGLNDANGRLLDGNLLRILSPPAPASVEPHAQSSSDAAVR